MTHPKNNLSWCWLSLLVIILDQASKYAIAHHLTLYQSKPILPFFNLTLLHNTGAAFSFLSQQPSLALWVFSAIAILMSIALVIWLYRLPTNQAWSASALALVLGGALGNVIDRLLRSYVIDFLDFYYQHWHFAAFNLADAAITIGAAMLLMAAVKRQPVP